MQKIITKSIGLAVLIAMLMGCNEKSDTTPPQSSSAFKQNDAPPDVKDDNHGGWPADPQKLVDHFNSWDIEELIAYNEPERFPNFKTSGETNGWIATHEEQLKKMKVDITWDRKQQKYVIEKLAP